MKTRVAKLLGWVIIGLLCLLSWAWAPAHCAAECLQVTCTTTLIESAVRAIGQDRVCVTTIIPYGMCPGHFDISPGEVARIKGSDLFIVHGFERFLRDLANGDKDTIPIASVGVQDNWMIPGVYIEAVERITDILSSRCPASAAFFQKNAAQYSTDIRHEEHRLLAELAYLRDTPVICSEMNASFIRWLGFSVVATFPRDEDISVKGLRDIVRAAKRAGVHYVFDNLQSSGRVGKTLASELATSLVMLSNFPSERSPSYIETLKQTGQKVTAVLHATPESR
jgi:ABC-type Zn uptake system ZnuABC Zn-binding protein ZnuA